MEVGNFQVALETFRQILPLKPCDSVALTSMGLCLSALGYKSQQSSTNPINYALKIKLMNNPNEFVTSNDPEELLEAGSTFNLSNIFYQVCTTTSATITTSTSPPTLTNIFVIEKW